MSKISLVLFIISIIISYEGFKIIFGFSHDIEGGPYFIAFLFGLPLFVIGMIIGIIAIFKDKKNESKNKNKDLKLAERYLATILNGLGVCLWVVHLLIVNLL